MKTCSTYIILFSMAIFFFPSVRAVNFQQFIIQLNGMSLLEINKRQGGASQGISYEIRGVSPANGQSVQYNLEPDTSRRASRSICQSVFNRTLAFFRRRTVSDITRGNYIGDLLPALIYTHHRLRGHSFVVTIHDDGNAELSMEETLGSRIRVRTTLHSAGSAPWDNFLDPTSISDNRLLHYFFDFINHSHLSHFIYLATGYNSFFAGFTDCMMRTRPLEYRRSLIRPNGDFAPLSSINGSVPIDLNSSNRRFDSNLNVQVSQSGEETLVLNVVGVVNQNGLDREILEPQVPLSVHNMKRQ